MNILYLREETYLRQIAQAIQSCDDKTVIIIGKREDSVFPIHAPKLEQLKCERIAEPTRKPWKERPKF